ncbi:hypothetical protein ACFPRL_13475 [Pseudoclavibacter helvolus]
MTLPLTGSLSRWPAGFWGSRNRRSMPGRSERSPTGIGTNRPRFGAVSFRVERMASCQRRLIPRCVSEQCGSCGSTAVSIRRERKRSRP